MGRGCSPGPDMKEPLQIESDDTHEGQAEPHEQQDP